MSRRKGFTLIELLVVVAIIALLISILLPSLARAREITKRAVCASNLRGIGQGMKVYSNENQDYFPISSYREPLGATGDEPFATQVNFIGNMGLNLMSQLDSNLNQTVHPSRSLFMLVIAGSCTAKQFICPSSGDSEDDMRNRLGGTVIQAATAGTNRFDFRGYPFMSYGYQLPFGTYARPNESLDPRMAIGADKGPFFDAGTSTGDPPWITPDLYVTSMGMNPGEAINLNSSDPSEILKFDAERWRPYNSRNHQQEGENVMFVDSHVDFVRKPIVGVGYDNIYTRSDVSYELWGSLLGMTPNNLEGPLTGTDTIIVP